MAKLPSFRPSNNGDENISAARNNAGRGSKLPPRAGARGAAGSDNGNLDGTDKGRPAGRQDGPSLTNPAKASMSNTNNTRPATIKQLHAEATAARKEARELKRRERELERERKALRRDYERAAKELEHAKKRAAKDAIKNKTTPVETPEIVELEEQKRTTLNSLRGKSRSLTVTRQKEERATQVVEERVSKVEEVRTERRAAKGEFDDKGGRFVQPRQQEERRPNAGLGNYTTAAKIALSESRGRNYKPARESLYLRNLKSLLSLADSKKIRIPWKEDGKEVFYTAAEALTEGVPVSEVWGVLRQYLDVDTDDFPYKGLVK